jgi:predicted nuclease of restriction endonuclease-like (RecB) superfamily
LAELVGLCLIEKYTYEGITMKRIEQNRYNDILKQIISEIKSTRVVVARRVNAEMMQLYWSIGERLSVEGLEKGYGSSVVKRLAADLQHEFPGTTGFSARNLWDMKKFFEFYKEVDVKLRQLVALLPWKHNLLIMSKTSSIDEAKYYAEQ